MADRRWITRTSIAIAILWGTVALLPAQEKRGPEAWRSSKGDFTAMVVFTDEPDAFMEQWQTPPDATPSISSVEEAHRGDTVVAFVFFGGCKPRNGNCDSEVDFRLLKPDGSVYAEHVGVELWKRAAPPSNNLQLSVANLGLRIEPEDPVGIYRLDAVVHDRNAKIDLSLTRELKVLKAR